MAVKKTTAPAKPAAAKAAPEVKNKYESKKFTAKIARMWHPDQKVYIDLEPVMLDVDSWTQCQVDAGLLIEA